MPDMDEAAALFRELASVMVTGGGICTGSRAWATMLDKAIAGWASGFGATGTVSCAIILEDIAISGRGSDMGLRGTVSCAIIPDSVKSG